MDKIEDFGTHADSYYQLKIEIYKSKTDERLLDLLWNKYWVETLSQSITLTVGLSHGPADCRTKLTRPRK